MSQSDKFPNFAVDDIEEVMKNLGRYEDYVAGVEHSAVNVFRRAYEELRKRREKIEQLNKLCAENSLSVEFLGSSNVE